MGFLLKKFIVIGAFCLSCVLHLPAFAGVFSEIDILVREAAIAQVDHRYTYDETDHAFYEMTFVVSQKEISGCHFVMEGEMEFPDRTYKFVACVVANSKTDITASIVDLQ